MRFGCKFAPSRAQGGLATRILRFEPNQAAHEGCGQAAQALAAISAKRKGARVERISMTGQDPDSPIGSSKPIDAGGIPPPPS